MSSISYPNAVAVFCGSRPGNEPAFTHAARSVGVAIARSGTGFVYGGGSKGIMGTASGAALEAGAKVTGVVPYAMVKDGKEVHKASNETNGKEDKYVLLHERGREQVETIVVHSMHERKVEMSKRVRGFIGLPGGFGTFEELLEVTTWSQIGMHEKPVVILNVLGFYNPLRELIQSGVRLGFIQPEGEGLVIFIDGPSDLSTHEYFDWGSPALSAIASWRAPAKQYAFDWTKQLADGPEKHTALDAS
ncbi:hypothetical protein K439DRAFT_1394619 [Ramaria rubella]|nr:hypothetical protein K439DRAFT_1394619 [Ramaria rubella]